MADAASEGPQDEVSSGEAPSSKEEVSKEEVQRKFREALERKHARETAPSSAGRGRETGKIYGARGPARHRRSFRRKSGG